MSKSLRTAFIRIFNENDTKKGKYVYAKDYIEKTLIEWQKTTTFDYWFIKHDPDIDDENEHYHIVLKFKNPVPFETLKNRFPYGDIENAKSIKACIQYLIHKNDTTKKQYDPKLVKTNREDIKEKYLRPSNLEQEISIEKIIEKISKGDIRQHNLFNEEVVPINLYSKHRVRIENALIYFINKVCMDKNRQIKVAFITGATGTGKTTLAKSYCYQMKKTYCISSSSNDPMQDYKGEDVLILDDLRDDDFKFSDLLKILDNHTKSSVRSRYNNKAFIGDTIIITSTKPLDEWYMHEPAENKQQLKRRITEYLKLTDDEVNTFIYNDALQKFEYFSTAPNLARLNARELAKKSLTMVEQMGYKFSDKAKKDINDNIDKINETNDEDPLDDYFGLIPVKD